MTDIVCISDTHTKHAFVDVPDGDILVHAGDFCGRGDVTEVSSFLDWMEKLPHKTKIVVPGNHDVCVEFDLEVRKEFKKSGIHLLIDEAYIEPESDIHFYGVPWTPDFYPDTWGFQYRDAGCTPKQIWDKVPEDTNILISHGPPYGCGDSTTTISALFLGSKELRDRIEELKVKKLRTVICGHIHGGYGLQITYTDPCGVGIVNASICTEQYAPTNKPITIVV